MINTHGETVYQVIATWLKNLILEGKLNPGDMLPSENEVVNRYKTTRTTVRKGLQILENEGFIHSWPGKGYFVSQPAHDVFTFRFEEEDQIQEIDYKNITVISANEELCSALHLSSEKKRIIQISKVIMNHKTPVAYDVKYIPYDKGIPIIESEINYAVFPEIVAAKSAPFAFYTKMEIASELATEEIAKLMKCLVQEPLLVIYRYFIDKNDIPIGYGKKYLRAQAGRLKADSGYIQKNKQ